MIRATFSIDEETRAILDSYVEEGRSGSFMIRHAVKQYEKGRKLLLQGKPIEAKEKRDEFYYDIDETSQG